MVQKTKKVQYSPLIFKLLLWMLPLVCIPIIVLGYLSFNTSVESFASLSKDNLMLEAQNAGNKVETIFNAAFMDMGIISSVLDEKIMFLADEQQSSAYKHLIRVLLNRFIIKSIYYSQISIWSFNGDRLFHVMDEKFAEFINIKERIGIINEKPPALTSISKLIYSPLRKGHYLVISRTLYNKQGIPIAVLMIDFDYERLISQVVNKIVPQNGYAFMVNKSGQILFHPEFKPYEYNLLNQEEPTMRKFIVEMLVGQKGWALYKQNGKQHAAAYSPVYTPGWSIAISIPFSEFERDAMELSRKIFALVFLTIVLCGIILFLISSKMLKPIKKLADATLVIADGNFDIEVKVESNDEVGMLTEAFNNMTKKLKTTQSKLIASEKLASLGRFSTGLAHEVRNPLSAIKGAATYIKRKRPGDGLVMEYIGLILNGINRLDTFINDFLYFSKENKLRDSVKDIKVHVNNAVTLFAKTAAQQNVKVINQMDKEPFFIKIDPYQIEQVLVNILINALQAMPEGGQLTISGHRHIDKVELFFKDTGCGIKPDDMKYIFDPFFSTKVHGTGLGLPICMGIVAAHQGYMSIDSTPEKGSIVKIELPVIETKKA